jgi:hypothetical protein
MDIADEPACVSCGRPADQGYIEVGTKVRWIAAKDADNWKERRILPLTGLTAPRIAAHRCSSCSIVWFTHPEP